MKNLTEEFKIERDDSFDSDFEKIENIHYYPFVGTKYKDTRNKILVFAHNFPVPKEEIEAKKERLASRLSMAKEINNYTYKRVKWTQQFRQFVRGCLAIKYVYHLKNKKKDNLYRVKDFVDKICFVNYINSIVESESKTNAPITQKERERSNKINAEIIDILKPTHIICWGKSTFDYLSAIGVLKDETRDLTEENIRREGFEYAKYNKDRLNAHVLKVYHPSMPKFKHNSDETHKIMSWFNNLKPLGS